MLDRIIATCAVTAIPPAWIDQLSPGGRIVAGNAGPLLVLDKTFDDEVTGIIDPGTTIVTPRPASEGIEEGARCQSASRAHRGLNTTCDPSRRAPSTNG